MLAKGRRNPLRYKQINRIIKQSMLKEIGL